MGIPGRAIRVDKEHRVLQYHPGDYLSTWEVGSYGPNVCVPPKLVPLEKRPHRASWPRVQVETRVEEEIQGQVVRAF